MNTAKCLRVIVTANDTEASVTDTTDRNHTAKSRRTLLLTMSLVWLVSLSPHRASAYGVYEDQIIDLLFMNYGIVRPASDDAPEFYRRAFLTPAPFDDDDGLQAIEGYLDPDEGDFADMYCIFIGGAADPVPLPGTPMMRYTPQEFSAKTVTPLGSGHTPMVSDPQLFLFDAMGHAIVGNDDISGSNLQSEIPAGTITQSGVYILAVTAFDYDPADADMNEMFTDNLTGLQTPANAGAVQAGWTGTHSEDAWYRVEFGTKDPPRYGAEHWIPEPSTFTLLVLGLGGLTLRRMRGSGRLQRKSGADSNEQRVSLIV